MRPNLYILILCFSVCIFTNCRVEKRLYRKGYHVVWNHQSSEPSKTKADLSRSETIEAVVAASEKEIIPIKPSPVLILKDTCGDKLLRQNADELLVKVIEISDDQIKYKRCDNADGPTYSISKKKVALITYANGVKEVILPESPHKEDPRSSPEKNVNQGTPAEARVNPLGLTSFIFAVGGWFLVFPFFLATPLAIISLFQFKNNPGKYRDAWMPRSALIVSAVFYFLLAMLLFLFLSTSVNVQAVLIFALVSAALGAISLVGLTILPGK